MDDPVQVARDRSCYKCGYYASTPLTVCPQCRSVLFTYTSTRVRGGLLVLIGIILMAMMTKILLWELAAFANTNSLNARFNGTEQQKMLIFCLFVVLILFGFASFATGIWQLIFGRRNKLFVWGMYGLSLLIAVGSGLVFWFFD